MPQSDILTGIDPTIQLDADRDRESRLQDVKPLEGLPSLDSLVPKPRYGTVEPGQNINIDKDSYQYNKNLYESLLDQGQKEYPDTAKMQPDILLPQTETDRYIDGKFGYRLGRDNEKLYHDYQGSMARLFNAGANIVGKTVGYTLQNLGFLVGAPFSALGDISNMTDNFLVKAGDYLKEGSENNFPIYKGSSYTNGNIWDKLTTTDWWLDDAMDRVALTLGMFMPGAMQAKGLSLAAMGEAGLKSLATDPENYSWIGKKFLSNLYNESLTGTFNAAVSPALKNYAKNLTRAELTTWNVIGQSGLNAKETQEGIKKTLEGERAQGFNQLSDDEISQKAAIGARDSFWQTVPMTFAGALIEVPMMYATARNAKSAIAKVFDKEMNVLPDALKAGGPSIWKTLGKSAYFGLEHGQNESMQVAISRYNEDRQTGKNSRGTISGIWGDFLDNINDPNGQNNIALGTIQGILMTAGGRMSDKYIYKTDQKSLSDRQKIYDTVMKGMLERQYYNGEFTEKDVQGNPIVENGQVKLNQVKAAEVGVSLANIQNDVNKRYLASQIGDHETISYLDHKNLTEFAYNFLGDTAGKEYLKGILNKEYQQQKNNLDRENDLDQFGNEITLDQQHANNLAKIDMLQKVYNSVDQRRAGFADISDVVKDKKDKYELQIVERYFQGLKTDQYRIAADQLFFKQRLDNNLSASKDILVKNTDIFEDTDMLSEEKRIGSPDNPEQERYNSLLKDRKGLEEDYDISKEIYKSLINKTAQKEAYEDFSTFFQEQKKEAEEKAKAETPKEKVEAAVAKANETVQNIQQVAKTAIPIAQQAAPIEVQIEEIKTKSLLEDNDKQELLSLGYTPDDIKYMTPEIGMNILLNKKTRPTELQQKVKVKQLVDKIKANTGSSDSKEYIHKPKYDEISKEIENAFRSGDISETDEAILVGTLNTPEIVAPEYDNMPKLVEEDPNQVGTSDDVKDVTDNGFNPATNDIVDTSSFNEDAFSAVAWKSSNKTVTQEEVQTLDAQGNPIYLGQLDENSYKNFKQKALRNIFMDQIGFQQNYGIQLIKDNNNFPRENGIVDEDKLGVVLIVTNKDGQHLYFDDKFSPSTTNFNKGRQLIYSINDKAWDDLAPIRAAIGELKSEIDADKIMESYEREKQERIVGRELAMRGYTVPLSFIGMSIGMIKQGKDLLETEKVLTGQKYSLHIASSDKAFNPEKPNESKYIIGPDGSVFLNGAVYIQTQRSDAQPDSFARIIPNKIQENIVLFEELRRLLLHDKYDANEAELVATYLNEMLFLGFPKRPIAIATIEGLSDKYKITILDNKIPMTNEQAVEFLASQKLNIIKKYINSNFNNYIIDKDGKLASENIEDYNSFITANSKTRARNLATSQGKALMNINTYMRFGFTDGLETMKAILDGEEITHPTENSVVEKDLDGLPELWSKAKTIKGINQEQLKENPLGYFQELRDQALFGNIAMMDKPENFGKDFMDDLLKFFGLSRDNKALTNNPLLINKDEQQAKIKAQEDLDNLLGKRDDLESKATDEQNQREALNRIQAVENIKKMFGNDVAVILHDIVNSDATALWNKSGIHLFLNAKEGDDYHESWHHFTQIYLSKNQKTRLYNEVRSRALNFTTRDGRKLNTKDATDLDIEEFTADDFRDYVKSDGRSVLDKAPQRNTIFRKILDFIKRFFFGAVDIKSLYDNLREGNLTKYTPSINNTLWGKLNSSLLNDKGLEIFNNQKSAYYRDVLSVFLGKLLKEKHSDVKVMMSDKKITAAIYNVLYHKLADIRKTQEELKNAGQDYNHELLEDLTVLQDNNNWNAFVRYHIKENKLQFRPDYDWEDVVVDKLANEANIGEDEFIIEEQKSEDITNLEDIEDNSDQNFDGNKALYDNNSGESVSSIVAASPETKGLVRLLSKAEVINGKIVPVLDHNGLEQLCDFSNIWNGIAITLADLDTYENMHTELSKQDNQLRIPEIKELLESLPHPSVVSTRDQINRALAFRDDMNRAYIAIYSGIMTLDKQFYFNEETKRNIDTIQKNWSNNFFSIDQNSNLVTNGLVSIDEDGKNFINPDAGELTFNLRTPEGQAQLMQILGLSFSQETLRYGNFRPVLIEKLQSIQNNINDRLKLGIKLFNPINEIKRAIKNDEGKQVVQSLASTVKLLATYEARFSNVNPSMSFFTAEGTSIYALGLHNFLSRNAGLINRAKTYDDLMFNSETQHLNKENNPNVTNSIILNRIFNKDRSKNDVRLIIGNYNGIKIATKKGEKAYSTTSLNLRDKVIMDIGALLTSGKVEIMRTETSKTAYFMSLSSFNGNSYLPLQIEKFKAGFKSPELVDIMVGYLEDELTRMKTADLVPIFKKDEKLMTAAKQFNLFRDILNKGFEKGEDSEKLKNVIKGELENSTPKDIIKKHKEQIEKAIIGFFESELESFKDLLNEEGINSEDLPTNLTDKFTPAQLSRAFIANDFILNVEYAKLFDGDTIYQAHYKDYHKRSKGAISTGKAPMMDDFFVRWMQSRQNNTLAGFLGVAADNDYKTTKSLVLSEDIRKSVYLKNIEENLLKNPKLSEDRIKEILDKYTDMKIADGQGHITLDFYRQFLISINNWSDEQEIAYRKELAWFRQNYSDMGNYTDEQKTTDKKYLEENRNVDSTFPPIKIQYNGPIDAYRTYAQAMDKFSVVPLIPSVIKGKNLEKLHLEMIKNGIGYSKYESGTKKYMSEKHKVYTDAGYNSSLRDYNAPVHFLNFLQEQIKTNPHIKTESIFGSQIRKLIFTNIFSQGQAREIDVQRFQRYVNIVNNLRNIELEKLYNELGLKRDGLNVVIDDLQRFISNIQKQADLRELNDNVKEYIQYDKDSGNFKYPLEASLNKKAIQSMIMGIVDKRIRRQKINGDMLVQVSSSGFEQQDFNYANPTEDDIKKYGTNAGNTFYQLKTDENGNEYVAASKVKVALIGGFEKLLNKLHPDGKRIGTIERLNELLQDEKWTKDNKDSITMIGYRIPTQGINSIEHMTISEFLPSRAGNIIIPPSEIVAKSGSDYDIDKMSVFRPSFDKDGGLIDQKTINELKKQLEDKKLNRNLDVLKNKFKFKGDVEALGDILGEEDDVDLDPDVIAIKEELTNLGNAKKQIYSNEIIKLYAEILSDPQMYEQLITPNDTNLVKPVSLEVAKAIGKLTKNDFDKSDKKLAYSGTQIYRYKNNLRKFESLTSSKYFLAVAAVNNSFSQILQQNDVAMNTTYIANQAFRDVTRKINLYLMNPKERDKVIKDGRINLSIRENVEGEYKQEQLSQFMNGMVDTPSDDFFGYVNINNENIGAIVYLINQGVPFTRILWFLNQPVMLKYYSELKSTDAYKSELQAQILGDLLDSNGKGRMLFFDNAYETEEGEIKPPRLNADVFNQGINNLLNGNQITTREGHKLITNNKRNIPDNFSFTEKILKQNLEGYNTIRSKDRKRHDVWLEDPKNSKQYQAAVFAYFITLQEQSNLFRNFQSAFNADTRKMQNQMEAFQLIHKVSQRKQGGKKFKGNIIDQGMFNANDIQQIERNSIISPFISNKYITYSLVKQLMPYISNIGFNQIASEFVNGRYLTKAKMTKLVNTIESDWIEYIVKSFGLIENQKLSSYSNSLLTGQNSIARRLVNMKNKYKDLVREYSVFNKLRTVVTSNQNVKNQNVEIQKLFEDTTDDQNRYIQEFRALLNFSDEKYTAGQQTEIRSFFRDLGIVAFAQSGFNRSQISFQELVPQELLSDIMKDALKEFDKDITTKAALLEKFVKNFISQFSKFNPAMLGSKKTKGIQAWRGKDYTLPSDIYSKILEDKLNQRALTYLDKLEADKLSILRPEVDEKGNVLVKGETLDNIITSKQWMLSLADKINDGERTINSLDDNKIALVDLKNIGLYKYNSEDNKFHKIIYGKELEGIDSDDFAKSLGYPSFIKMTKDEDMLAFTAGLQNKNIYKITHLLSGEAPKENINDELENTDENILPSEEKVVPLDMSNIDFQEEQSSGYRNRTIKNASADATIAIAVDFNSAGEKLTKSSVLGQGKKYVPIDMHRLVNILEISKAATEIVDKLKSLNKKEVTLNIAGNGIYTMRHVNITQEEMDRKMFDLLNAVLAKLAAIDIKIVSIRTGGQTGADEAGAKASIRFGKKTIVLAPKGWTFRNEQGVDIHNEKMFKERFMDTISKTKLGITDEQIARFREVTKEIEKELSLDMGEIKMQPDNVEKIKSGEKTITNRTEKERLNDGIYILPDGTKVEVKLLGKAKFDLADKTNSDSGTIEFGEPLEEDWSLDEYAKAEGFKDWKDFEQNNKFSQNFINGKQSRYVYSIKPIEEEIVHPTENSIEELPFEPDEALKTKGLNVQSFNDFKNSLDKKDC